MTSHIVLAPGADENPLASWAFELLRGRLTSPTEPPEPSRTAELARLRATVGLVARDLRVSATLRFDRGTVMVHDGAIGTPDVTFVGALDTFRRLTSVPLAPLVRLPLTRRWLALVAMHRTSELTVYGLVGHPRLVLRLLRLLAPAR